MNIEAQLRLTWNLFKDSSGIVEVRALGCHGKHAAWDGWTQDIVNGYFDDEEAFVEAVTKLDASGLPSGIYVTLNPVLPDLIARAANRLVGGRRGDGAKDDEILRRRWILLDFDPVRPVGISATKEELAAALATARQARTVLAERGWPLPVLACSGNGFHLLYRVELANDDDAKRTTQDVLAGLAKEFSGPAVQIDTAVYNAGRITKLYGTIARKGDSTQTRPHRRAAIVEGIEP